MKMTVTQQRLQDEAADAILLSHWESEDKFSGETAAIDAALKGRLRELLKNGEFSGRLGQISILPASNTHWRRCCQRWPLA